MNDGTVSYEAFGYWAVPIGTIYLDWSEMCRVARVLRETGNDGAAEWLEGELNRIETEAIVHSLGES